VASDLQNLVNVLQQNLNRLAQGIGQNGNGQNANATNAACQNHLNAQNVLSQLANAVQQQNGRLTSSQLQTLRRTTTTTTTSRQTTTSVRAGRSGGRR
jgi:hypothetical protein